MPGPHEAAVLTLWTLGIEDERHAVAASCTEARGEMGADLHFPRCQAHVTQAGIVVRFPPCCILSTSSSVWLMVGILAILVERINLENLGEGVGESFTEDIE